MTHELFMQAASATALGFSIIFWLVLSTEQQSDQGNSSEADREPQPNCSYWD